MLEDSRDPGKWRSRKLQMALICLGLITLGFFAREGLDSLESVYSQFVAGVLGILTLYLGGNVGNKYVVAKSDSTRDGNSDGTD